MAEKNYKLDDPIEIVYQAPNAGSGLDIKADIYKPDKSVFSVDNPLDEVGNSGTYRASFVPNVVGEWQAIIYKFVDSDTRDGQVTKRYSVGAHNVDSVGQVISGIDTVVDEINADVAIVDSKVDGILEEFGSGGVIVDIDNKLDSLDTKVSSLDTPPMVS